MCYTPVPILQSLHETLHLVPSSHTQLEEHEHSLLRIDPHAVVLMRTPHFQTEPIQTSADTSNTGDRSIHRSRAWMSLVQYNQICCSLPFGETFPSLLASPQQ